MKAYLPKIQVRLVKVVSRKEVTPGVAAVLERYSQNKGFDLTPFLGENGGVRLAKGVHDPAGGFSITLTDQRHPLLQDSIYALIEPMDMIEFRVAHDPFDYAKPTEGYSLPVVMRGLVSSVTRSEAMQGDKPMRSVTITGQDFGKVLQIIQIFYLNNSVVGDNLLSQFAFFQKYSNAANAKIMSASDFLMSVASGVIGPYLSRMLAASHAAEVGAQKIDSLTVRSSVAGTISPFALTSFNNVSLFSMLSQLLDVGPFNELFVQDEPTGIALVARPAPLRTPDGQWIQTGADGKPATAEFIEIPSSDVMSINVSRSDAGVANYFWAANTRWTMMQNETARSAAMGGPPGDFVLFDYPNASSAMYGVRKMEVDVVLGPPGAANSDGAARAALNAETSSLLAWLQDRRRVLATINKDNVVFESGAIRVRGNEKIKAGMYLRLVRGVGRVPSEFYVTRVDHEFHPFGGFFTTLQVERGTSFIARASSTNAVYLGEIDAGGVF